MKQVSFEFKIIFNINEIKMNYLRAHFINVFFDKYKCITYFGYNEGEMAVL